MKHIFKSAKRVIGDFDYKCCRLKGILANGFGMVEVIVSIAVVAGLLYGLGSVAQRSMRLATHNLRNVQANFLLQEGLEAVRVLRDSGWSANIASITNGIDYYLDYTGGVWQLVASPSSPILGIFERKIRFDEVKRNASDDISPSGAIDPNTRKVTVSISWDSPDGTVSKSISTYITNIFND